MKSTIKYFGLILMICCLSSTFKVQGQNNDKGFGKLQPISATNIGQLQQLQYLGFGSINDLVWTPDGNTLIVATHRALYFIPFADNHLMRWDTTVFPIDAPIHAIAISTDGKHLATALDNGTVTVWDIQDLSAIGLEHTFSDHTPLVYGVAFSPDGKWLASADASLVRVWELATEKLKMTLPGHTAVVFSPDGKLIAAASEGVERWQYDHAVRIWDSATGEELYVLKADTGIVQSLAFSLQANQLMVGGTDNDPVIWHLDDETVEVLTTSTPPLEAYNSYVLNSAHFWDVAINHQGNVAMGIRSDGQIHDWDVRSAPSIWLNEDIYLSNFHYRPNTVAFQPKQNILTAGFGGILVLMESGEVIDSIGDIWGFDNPVFHPENRWIAGVSSGSVIIFDIKTGMELGSFSPSHSAQNIAFSPDGRFIAVTTYQRDPEVKQIEVWQIDQIPQGISATFVQNFPYVTTQFPAVFNAAGELLIEPSLGELSFVDAETGEAQSAIHYEGTLVSLLQTPEGFLSATVTTSNQLELWTLTEDAQQVTVFDDFETLPTGFVRDKAWRAIPIDINEGLWLIDATSNRQLIEGYLYFHTTALSLDRSLLILANNYFEATPQAWNTQTGQLIPLRELGIELQGTSVAFNADDTLLVAGMEVWGIPEQD